MPDILKGKSIFKNSFFSLLSKFIPLIISLISVPIVINNIGEERFGILAISWAFIGYFNFFDFGLGKALTKSISEKLSRNKTDEIKVVFSTSLTITSILGIISGVFFFFLSKPITLNYLTISSSLIDEVLSSLVILSFGIPFVILSSSLRGALEAYHEFKKITAAQVLIGSFTYLGLIAISFNSQSIYYLIIWLSLQKVLLNLFLYYYCTSSFNLRYQISLFNKKSAFHLFSFGGWVTVSSVIAPIIDTVDRLIIGGQKSMTNLAYYSVPIDLIKRLGILPSSISLVLFPIFSRELEEEDQKKNLFIQHKF
jgi:O-antigen/teichoic acid export membrane protein